MCPAKSKSQQKFMGMVHGVQKGTVDPDDVSPEVKKVAKTMKKKDVKDFAKTKHKGLPVKVKESNSPSVKNIAITHIERLLNASSVSNVDKKKLKDIKKKFLSNVQLNKQDKNLLSKLRNESTIIEGWVQASDENIPVGTSVKVTYGPGKGKTGKVSDEAPTDGYSIVKVAGQKPGYYHNSDLMIKESILNEYVTDKFRLKPKKDKDAYDIWNDLKKHIQSKGFTKKTSEDKIFNEFEQQMKSFGYKKTQDFVAKGYTGIPEKITVWVKPNKPAIKLQQKKLTNGGWSMILLNGKQIIGWFTVVKGGKVKESATAMASEMPKYSEYGYTKDGVVQCIASKNICNTRMKADRERNPGSKFQLIYDSELVVGEVYDSCKKENKMNRKKLKEQIRKIIREDFRKKLEEKVQYADTYGREDGIALGLSGDGIYVLKMDKKGKDYFSMNATTLAPVTKEMFREWEADSVASEIDYYWENGNEQNYSYLFDWYDDLKEEYEAEGYDVLPPWNALTGAQQTEVEDVLINDIVQSKLDSMSGEFSWKFGGRTENYYLEMISGGQDKFDSIKFPIIPKKTLQILYYAWKKLHLKHYKKMDAGEIQLMRQAYDEYSKLGKSADKLLEKSIQAWMVRGKSEKVIQKMMKKLGYKSGKVSPKSLARKESLPLLKKMKKKK